MRYVNCLFFCFYVVRSVEKEDFLENLHVLSCFVQLKSVLFNLLCVLDPFSELRQSTLFQVFFHDNMTNMFETNSLREEARSSHIVSPGLKQNH